MVLSPSHFQEEKSIVNNNNVESDISILIITSFIEKNYLLFKQELSLAFLYPKNDAVQLQQQIV